MRRFTLTLLLRTKISQVALLAGLVLAIAAPFALPANDAVCPADTVKYLAAVGVAVPVDRFTTIREFSLRENEKAKEAGPVRLYCFRNLAALDLSHTRLEPDQWPDFARFPRLRALSLVGNSLPDSMLGKLNGLRIENLNLALSSVKSEQLALIKNLPLKTLSVANTPAGNGAGIEHIKTMKSLEELGLSMCDVRGEQLLELAKLPRLKRLALRSAAVSPGVVERLKKLRPDLVVEQ